MRGSHPHQIILRRLNARMAAQHYNPIRLALLRLGAPLKVMVPGMRGFEMLLHEQQWLLRDHKLDDQPLVAWSDFHPQWRDDLAEPVQCSLLHYHAYGAVLARNVLTEVTSALEQRIAEHSRRESTRSGAARVITLPPYDVP